MSAWKHQRSYEKSEISTSTSASTNRRYPLNLPPPPTIATASDDFTCPYCHLVLKSKVFKEKGKAWRKHVTLDLEPYICIFSNCKSQLEIYPTKVEWLSHMKTSHRTRWQCFAVQAGHEPFISETAEEFESHMITAHSGDFRTDELSLITEISHQPISPTIECCPFCVNYPTKSLDLEEHVVQHLQDFALHSIEVPTSLLPIQPRNQDSLTFSTDDDDGLDSKAPTRSTIKKSRLTWKYPLVFDDRDRSSEKPPSPDYKKISSFGQLINDDCCYNHNGDEFLPNDRFLRSVNRSCVVEILRAANLDTEPGLIDFVMNDATRLFLILVSMSRNNDEKVSILRTLKYHLFTDNSLPISFRVTQDAAGRNTIWNWHPATPAGRFGPQDPLRVAGWGHNEKTLFNVYQWRFMAPTFGIGQPFRFEFQNDTVLPYTTFHRRAESIGFFGEVSKVNIHPAHIEGPNIARNKDGSIPVALKKANDDPELRKFFDKEANNLQKLRDYKSKHLIKPIAAYEHQGDRCLLLPWAEGGNLAQYWSRNPGNSLTNNELVWLFGQFAGLFGAIEELHRSNCRHGDLKPENILLFIDVHNNKTLQIADLGLTTFHELDAATNIRKSMDILTVTPPGTSRYMPPEMDIDRDKNLPAHPTRSRAYDIWSMGCVVLELLIWLAYGFDIMMKFRNETAYFWERVVGEEKKYQVQSDVQRHMKALSANWQVQSACGELLKLVQTRLLVVNVSENWLISSPDFRETASAAHREMRRIQREYCPVCTDDGLAPGHDDEHNGSKPSLPSHDNSLNTYAGLGRLDRQALEELELRFEQSVVESDYFGVDTQINKTSGLIR
ncbi:hypothetical protein CGLO_00339 [Colletotrichum gloeosporioides Cg-14]|uniref:Protein kinase domain-containing protein n=1 Tax=Colletotrichum gloeosporioides (strain Cg-14) TaxID=1237896 RepID=T0L3D1_COLGC|nr:hypothetical protein CGLO_00339 [Colletotrichum gloeosporioides Cg-14]